MSRKSADEIIGFEFDWLACDADGHVAQFSTAGGGYAPGGFLRDTDAHGAAIDAILAAPVTTRPRFAPEIPGPNNTWRDMAERGIFAFDSSFHGGPYRLVAAPEVPIRVHALPDPVAEIARRIVFSELRFRALSEIPDQLLCPQP
ncbi:MAG: hypothetical protein H0U13_15915 [Gemmatimonadaceae bacterium]|nr:hypothetical protein [Gemmatimonadaceae bacterium]